MIAEEKRVLTMLVDNQPGVLSRVTRLFSGRGYNIDSLCVAETVKPTISRITIVTRTHMAQLEQIMKQLRKLVNVRKLRDLTGKEAVHREMALICVNAKAEHRARDEQEPPREAAVRARSAHCGAHPIDVATYMVT